VSGHDRVQLSPQPKVLLVDDDELFRESLGLNLEEEGFDILPFERGEDALAYLLGGRVADAILLDWRMPGMNGLEVLKNLRAAQCEVPVVFLTALGEQVYEEAALKFGAVDFIEKSRRLPIILQRLRLITMGNKALATQLEDPPQSLILGDLELDTGIKRAKWCGEAIDLTLSEFFIVHYLVSNRGRDVTYRQIYDLVRGRDFVAGEGDEGYRANVRAFIKRIRKKFRLADSGFEGIENYPGYGYRWQDPEGER
jgi:two-component system response regulator ChvI